MRKQTAYVVRGYVSAMDANAFKGDFRAHFRKSRFGMIDHMLGDIEFCGEQTPDGKPYLSTEILKKDIKEAADWFKHYGGALTAVTKYTKETTPYTS